jgi:nucleotide-binding universal stress UspA family protein
MRPDNYLPIAEHGVIGDLRTVALVGTDGTIDWLCCPRFDSPSVFGAILGSENGGHYRIAPVEECSTKQLYFPDTNVLITRFLSPHGVAELEDFMPVGGEQRLVRRVKAIRGELRFRLECEPRFDYGRDRHDVLLHDGGAVFRSAELCLALSGPVTLAASTVGVSARFALAEGESATFVLESTDGAPPRPLGEAGAQAVFEETVDYWRTWIGQSSYTGRWREMVNRSALALKLLTYEPTGAIVAAPTASLPEQLGGGRNWDYRYTWIRDASFTLYALLKLGFTDEARAFGGFLLDRLRGASANGSGPLQIMYGIDGRTELPEEILGHLEGYRGSAPVRIGNGAADQLQLDVYGEIIDAAYLLERHSGRRMPYDAWAAIAHTVDWLCANWDRPDEGIWETRGGRKGLERAPPGLRAARGHRGARRGRPADAAHGVHLADRPALALDARRDRLRARLRQPRLPLRPGGLARRPRRGRGHILDLQLLVRRGAHAGRTRRGGAPGLREDAHVREPPRALLRGGRAQRRAPRELPAGVHTPRADQRRDQARRGALEEAADAADRRLPGEDLEPDARHADDQAEQHDREVLEQHAERDQHDAQRGEGVEAGERGREERADGPGDDERSEDDVARPVVEQERQARARKALEAPDQLHQATQEALASLARELDPAPAPGQPDLPAPRDQLDGEQHRDELEDVRGAAGRQRERRHREQEDEYDREALLAEVRDEAAEGGVPLPAQPVLEVAADAYAPDTKVPAMGDEVIVGIDRSEQAEDALALARVLTRTLGGTLVLAHVVSPTAAGWGGPELDRAVGDQGRELLDRVAARIDDVPVERRLLEWPSAAAALHDLADDLDARLLVIGSAHRGAVGRLMLGSVAHGLLTGAPGAVAVAPLGYRERAPDRLRTVGVA